MTCWTWLLTWRWRPFGRTWRLRWPPGIWVATSPPSYEPAPPPADRPRPSPAAMAPPPRPLTWTCLAAVPPEPGPPPSRSPTTAVNTTGPLVRRPPSSCRARAPAALPLLCPASCPPPRASSSSSRAGACCRRPTPSLDPSSTAPLLLPAATARRCQHITAGEPPVRQPGGWPWWRRRRACWTRALAGPCRPSVSSGSTCPCAAPMPSTAGRPSSPPPPEEEEEARAAGPR